MINTITEQKRYHYVYQLTNTKPITSEQLYIGVHSSNILPEEDNYMSSSKYIKLAIKHQGDVFKKEILSLWDTREEAANEEIRLHSEIGVSTNERYYNRYDSNNTSFTTEGKVVADDLVTGERTLVSKKVFTSMPERYVSPNKGTMIVKDIRNNKFKQVTVQAFEEHNYYVGSLQGQVIVNDTRDNSRKLVSKEDFNKYEYFIGTSTDTVVVVDTRDNTQKRVSKEDFKYHNYYVSITKNKVNVLDTRDNTTTQVSKEEFDEYDYYVACNKSKPVAVYSEKLKKNILISKEEFDKGSYIGLNMNMVPVANTITGATVLVTQEEFEKYAYYSHTSCKTFKIFNNKNELQHTITTGFAAYCKNNNLPLRALERSYQDNSTPIYPNPTAKLTKNGNIKYQGWYAIKEV